jgi:hypothetical protein
MADEVVPGAFIPGVNNLHTGRIDQPQPTAKKVAGRLNPNEAWAAVSDTHKIGDRVVTVPERIFLQAIMEGFPPGEAYIKAYGEEKTIYPRQNGYNLRRKLEGALLQELEKRGLSTNKLVEKFEEGLEACSVEYFSDKDGVVQDERKGPDHECRRRYLDMLLKMRGEYAPAKVETETNVTVRNGQVASEIELKQMLGQIAQDVGDVVGMLEQDKSLSDAELRRLAAGGGSGE